MRRILLCTIGATPQVVTETVWALLNQRESPWRPDEIHIVTTAFALTRIREGLQRPDGPLASLLQVSPPPVTVHVPCTDRTEEVFLPLKALEGDEGARERQYAPVAVSDGALRDINSESDAAAMGNLILRLMVGFVSDPEAELHVSLAGGRKTMSAHALMALGLVGRPRDEATHVLVSPEFEDHPDFWHPDQEGGALNTKEDLRTSPRPSPSLSPTSAKVVLVRTPVPLMRYEVEHSEDLENLDLVDLVALANLASVLERNPHVFLDTRSNTISAGGVSRKLGAKLFAVYRLIATAKAGLWSGTGRDGCGPDDRGWLSFEQICTGTADGGKRIDLRFLEFLKDAITAESKDPDDDRTINEWIENCVKETRPSIKLKHVRNNLSPNLGNLDEAIRKSFGRAAASFLLPTGSKTRPVRFGLEIPPDRIKID